jgi:acyl carrier protein
MNDTETSIRQILADVAALTAGAPSDANLYFDLGVASVQAMQLLVQLEERFDIQVPDEDFVEATSIAQLVEMTEMLLAEKAGEGAHA